MVCDDLLNVAILLFNPAKKLLFVDQHSPSTAAQHFIEPIPFRMKYQMA